MQYAIAKVLIFVLTLAAKFYDALRDQFAGFDRAVRDLKERSNIVERVRHGLRRLGSEHVNRSHWALSYGYNGRFYDADCVRRRTEKAC